MLVWGLMLLRSKLFYCLWLPIQSNARGGDQKASLGINAASQQTHSSIEHSPTWVKFDLLLLL